MHVHRSTRKAIFIYLKIHSKIVPMLSQAPHRKDVWEVGGTAPHINFGIRWMWMVSFTSRRLYLWQNWSRYPRRNLSWTQSPCERGDEEKNPSTCRETNPGCPACSLVTILTELSHHHSMYVWSLISISVIGSADSRIYGCLAGGICATDVSTKFSIEAVSANDSVIFMLCFCYLDG